MNDLVQIPDIIRVIVPGPPGPAGDVATPYKVTGGEALRTSADRGGERMSVEEWRTDPLGVARTDTQTIQAAVDAMLASATIGEIYIPARSYTITASINVDFSSATGNFDKRPVISGQGVDSVLTMLGVAAPLFNFTGPTTNQGHIRLRNFRLAGNNTIGSKGIYIDKAAFFRIEGIVIEGFDYNFDCIHVEQSILESCNFRWGIHGVRFQPDSGASITDPNSIVLLNCNIAVNRKYGLYAEHVNAFTMIGGAIADNGTASGAADEWGVKIYNAGSGYGTVVFIGVAFEGNKGTADVISMQDAFFEVAMSFVGSAFLRNHASGYVINNILIEGASATALYSLGGNRFFKAGDYVEDTGRPYIKQTNPAAIISDLSGNDYASATEAPGWTGRARLPGLFINSDITPITPITGSKLQLRHAVDQNFFVAGPFNAPNGITIGSINDSLANLQFMELRAGQVIIPKLQLDYGTKTATAAAGAATLNKSSGKITTESLTTVAGATYTLTLTNSSIAAADQVYVSVANGTNTQGMPVVTRVTPGITSVIIVVTNMHASQALNGTLIVSFMVAKA